MPLRFAMILAGGVGSRLCVLSDKRAKPAVPFAGKYRIIDFTLSNCVNSGLTDVAILTQYRPVSLHQHIGIGKPWDLDRRHGGVRLMQPYPGWQDTDWYKGTADAVLQNLDAVRDRHLDDVLILSGDHVYTMDYNDMYEFHTSRRADLTIGVVAVSWADTHSLGIVELEADGAVQAFVEKPRQRPRSNLASMGVYLFRTDTLIEALEEDARRRESRHDFGRDVIPALIENQRVYGYPFRGYWQDIGTVDSYYRANLDLASPAAALDLHCARWRVHTVETNHQPVKFVGDGHAEQSLLSNGCIVRGTVINSVLSPGVVVEAAAEVRDSILLSSVCVGPGSVVDGAIIDKNVSIGAESRVGGHDPMALPNQRCPEHLGSGLTVVGKNSRVPPGAVLGSNVRIGSEVHEKHFPDRNVPDGGAVEAPGIPSH